MRTSTTALAAFAAATFITAPTLADDDVKEVVVETWARSQSSRLGLEVDVLSRTLQANLPGSEASEANKAFAAGFAVVAQIPLFGGFFLDAELPFAYGSGPVAPASEAGVTGEPEVVPIEDSGFFLGNPTIGVHYSANLFPSLALFGGLSVSFPTVFEPSSGTVAAAEATLPARAYFDTHRMTLEHMPVRARGGAEVRLSVLHIRGDLAGTFSFPTGGGDTTVVVEHSDEIEVRLAGIGAGMRLQVAFPLSATDKLQLAAEPFACYEPSDSGLYARLGYLVALDPPLGFGLKEGKVATVRAALGLKF